MKTQRILNGGTPREVIDAIYVIAKYLNASGYAEASIHPSGGASFHVQSRIDREREYLKEIAKLKGWNGE